jgi:hypothetical protein
MQNRVPIGMQQIPTDPLTGQPLTREQISRFMPSFNTQQPVISQGTWKGNRTTKDNSFDPYSRIIEQDPQSEANVGKRMRKDFITKKVPAGVTAAAAIMAAPLAAPIVSAAMSAPLTIGSTILPYVTPATVIGAGFGLTGANNLANDFQSGYYFNPKISKSEKIFTGLTTGLDMLGTPGAVEAIGSHLITPAYKGALKTGKYLTEETALKNAYNLNSGVLKENPETFLYRAEPSNFNSQSTIDFMKQEVAAGRGKPWYKPTIKSYEEGHPKLMAQNDFHGQWLEKDPARLDFYLNSGDKVDVGTPMSILRTKIPTSEAGKYSVANNAKASVISASPNTEFVMPRNIIEQGEKFPASSWQQLMQEDKAFNTPHWLKGYGKKSNLKVFTEGQPYEGAPYIYEDMVPINGRYQPRTVITDAGVKDEILGLEATPVIPLNQIEYPVTSNKFLYGPHNSFGKMDRGLSGNIGDASWERFKEKMEMHKWIEEQLKFIELPKTKNKESLGVLEDFKTRIQTPEGQKRLKELGITNDDFLQNLDILEDPTTFGYYTGGDNKIVMNPNNPLPRKVVRHEIEHGVQSALLNSNLNKVIKASPYEKLKALESGKTEIDNILSGLELRKEGTPDKVWDKTTIEDGKPVDINEYKSKILNKQNATDYFLTGSEGKEKSAFLAEVQQHMMDKGIIPKTSYTEITPEMVKETFTDAMFDEEGGGKYLRLFNIMKPTENNYKLISKGLNKMLSLTPYAIPTAIGAGALNKKQQGGHIITNRGQWDYPGQTTIIPSNQITMQGVPYPVMGVDNTGHTKMMHPGMNYTFPGQYVTEYPMMKGGGQKFNMYNYMGNLNGYPLQSPNVAKPIYNIGSKQQPVIDNTKVVKPVIDYFNDPQSQYTKGVEYTQNQANKAKEFHTKWMNSPMYKKMLQKSDPVNAETIEKNRWINYNNIKLNYNPIQMHGRPNVGAASFTDDGHIEVYPHGVEDNVSGVGTHEVSHSIDKPINFFKFLLINKQRNIPQKDINKMQNYSNYNKSSQNENLTSEKYQEDPEFYNYVAEPTETRARLSDIRQHAYESKLYDPFTQKVDKNIFNKLLNFKYENKGVWSPLWQLQKVYSNNEIMDLLNSVSKNNTDNNLSMPYAAFGGQMMRDGGSKNPTKYVTNPNSRSLRMYNDSLYNYNNAARIKNDYIRGWNNMQVTPTMSQDDFESNSQNIFNNISRVNNGTPAGLIISDNDLPNANPYYINDRYGRSRNIENIAPDFNFVEPVQPVELKKTSPTMQFMHPQKYNPMSEWEQRLYNGSKLRLNNDDGSYSSHKMMNWEQDGKYYAAPTIINKNGKLIELSPDDAIAYHKEHNSAKEFNSDAEAMQYADNGYKALANVEKPESYYLPINPLILPQQKGRPVYGPGSTIIGYRNDDMKFNPAYQYTGAPNNPFNLQDKELLNNPELLKQYIYNQDSGYHYKGGGEMIKRADGSYSKRGLWDNIRDNRGSGKAPTKQMLDQERKIRNQYQVGGDVPTVQGNFKKQNEYGYMVTDEEALAKEAQRLNSKRVLTENGSLIIFDDNWNIIAADDNPSASYQKGGEKLPNDFNKFQEFNKTLPDNLRDDDFKYGDYSHYDLYGMWDASGKPNSFNDVKDTEQFGLQEDGTYHGFSVGNDGVWLKPKSHPSAWMEYMQGQLSTDPYFKNNHVIQREDGRLQYVPKTYMKKQGGGVILNTGGEQHRIYVKSTNRGEGNKGHIMVNHPTMDKGMWDTIDLTQKAGATTIAQGVAATKEWHRENPYMKQRGGEQNNNLKNINLNLPVIRHQEMNPLHFNGFLANDKNQNLFIGGVNPRYQNEDFSVGPYMIGVGNKYFQKFPADMGMSGTYHVNDNFDINMGVGQNNVNAGIKYNFANGGYVVRRSHDRKGKTHVVTGPDGTKKYFGDPNMGERGNSKYGKEAFYARHKSNLANNPYFRAYARATWEEGGEIMAIGGQTMMNPITRKDNRNWLEFLKN